MVIPSFIAAKSESARRLLRSNSILRDGDKTVNSAFNVCEGDNSVYFRESFNK